MRSIGSFSALGVFGGAGRGHRRAWRSRRRRSRRRRPRRRRSGVRRRGCRWWSTCAARSVRGASPGSTSGSSAPGIEWRATPTLRLQASALLLGATGSTDSGRDRPAVAPAASWRRAWFRSRAGPFVLTCGPRAGCCCSCAVRSFPAATSTISSCSWAPGSRCRSASGWRCSAICTLVHLSNGQGLGPCNPAFTGEGGLIGAAYALAPPGPAAEPEPVATVDEARPDWRPGATFDAGAGQAAAGTELAVRDRVAQRLTRHTLALMDIESGTIDSAHFVEAGLDLAGHWTFVSAGVHSGYRHVAGTGTFVESAQVEAVISHEASLVLLGQAELPRAGGGRVPRRGGPAAAADRDAPDRARRRRPAASAARRAAMRQRLRPLPGARLAAPVRRADLAGLAVHRAPARRAPDRRRAHLLGHGEHALRSGSPHGVASPAVGAAVAEPRAAHE